MMFRPLPILTVCAVAGIAVLIMFGNWQWGRYTTKMARRDAPPVWAMLEGVRLPGTERIVYTYVDGTSAWRQVAAIEAGGAVVFVPERITQAIDPPQIVPGPDEPQQIALRGLWRPGEQPHAFSAADDAGQGVFYTFNPAALAASLALLAGKPVEPRIFEPEIIVQNQGGVDRAVANPRADPVSDDRLPPERHFGYALTWWGLAAALAGVYLVFHHQRGRLRLFRKRGD